MDITFGWGYDGARWSDSDTPATRGTVVVGPARFADLLATRLACTAPEPEQPTRIAAVRTALSTVLTSRGDDDPFLRSFRADPWSLARTVLAWRDELVSAGWDGTSAQEASPRLTLLSRVDALVTADPRWATGPSDQLRTIAGILGDLAAPSEPVIPGAAWPLGIDRVTVDNTIADLPPVWRSILDDLAVLGVEITEEDAPGPIGNLRIITTDAEWDAASTTTRILADTLVTKQEPVTVVASLATDLVDRELARRDLPRLGVRDRSSERGFAQIVPVFLAAVTSPPDVHAIGALLEHTVTTGTDRNSDPVPIRLVPGELRHALIQALSNEPGVGGPLWREAVDDGSDLARDLDRMIRETPLAEQDGDVPGYPTGLVSTHLTWLAGRLHDLARPNGDKDLKSVASGTATAGALITDLGDTVSLKELTGIVADCTASAATSASSGSGATSSTLQDVVSNPAQLGMGTTPVLWCVPVDDQASPARTFRPSEIAALAESGVELPDREALSSLTLDSQLRAVRRRREVTAVLPAEVDGETAAPHPVLTFLADDLRDRDGTDNLEDVLARVIVSATDLVPDAAHRPAPTDPVRPDPVERAVDPGEHLIPGYLSYSQWTGLLAHPLEWLLERQLGIRAGGLTSLPEGNQMIGTYLHAVVEGIVERHLESGKGPASVMPTRDEINHELTALLPQYASELLLPGRGRERGIVLESGLTAITGLFTMLDTAGILVAGAEAKYRTTIPDSRGAGGEPLSLGGYRDLDIVLPDGRTGVIDLKYTNSKKKYRELVEEGAALQLAVYAYSVSGSVAGGDTAHTRHLFDIPVGYFSLKQDRMDTSSPDFGAPDILEVNPRDNGARDPDALWFRAVSGLNRILDDLRDGRITDVGNIIELDGWKDLVKKLEKARKDLKKDPEDIIRDSPFTREQVNAYQGAIDVAVHRDFLPLEITRYTGYALITGLTGDYRAN